MSSYSLLVSLANVWKQSAGTAIVTAAAGSGVVSHGKFSSLIWL